MRGLGSRFGTICASWVVGALLSVWEWPAAVQGATMFAVFGLIWCAVLASELGIFWTRELGRMRVNNTIAWKFSLRGWLLMMDPPKLADRYACCASAEGEAAEMSSEGEHGEEAAKEQKEEIVDNNFLHAANDVAEAVTGMDLDGDGDIGEGKGGAPINEWIRDSRFWTMNVVNGLACVLMAFEVYLYSWPILVCSPWGILALAGRALADVFCGAGDQPRLCQRSAATRGLRLGAVAEHNLYWDRDKPDVLREVPGGEKCDHAELCDCDHASRFSRDVSLTLVTHPDTAGAPRNFV